jgi:type II secretory pathway predicted ATPase ExeA
MALYLEHFGLNEPPFRITPHTDFFFDGADRGATLEGLIYAVLHDEGIVKVSGEVGSGKTMLCRVLMERLPPQVDTIYLASPSLAREEILHAIGDELGLALSAKRTAVAVRELQEHLIRRYGEGRRVVVLVDEAHVMPDDTLEEVRLLSNLESNRHKLLQIVLFGQPELDATLAKPSLRQLRDRVTHAFRMRPLSPAEVHTYVSFRMRAAGYRGPEVFAPRAIALIARAASGLTRRVNILADKALLVAFTENVHAITARHVRAAVRDAEFAALSRGGRRGVYVAAGATLAVGVALGIALQSAWLREPPAPIAPAHAAPAPEQPRALTQSAPSLLDADQARRIEGYTPAGNRLLAERLAATRDALLRAPDEAHSIELFVSTNSEPARMERFLLRARELVPLEELYVIPMEWGGQYRLRVVYGSFATADEAAAAEKRLPPKYQQAFRTSIRSFGELRRQI